jgi:hypothetical protein
MRRQATGQIFSARTRGILLDPSGGMMLGYITECDFKEVEIAFPGIVHYYRELKTKPTTFLELLWGFTHRDCACSDSLPVATSVAVQIVAR